MSTIERIKELEVEIENIKKFLNTDTITNGELCNGIGISIWQGDNKQIISSYWFGVNSGVDITIVERYVQGLNNSLDSLLKTLRKEIEESNSLLNKYKK